MARFLCLFLFAAGIATAETAVLRNGQRLRITGYETEGAQLRLHVAGGTVVVRAEDVIAIEPEDQFPVAAKTELPSVPYAEIIRAAAERHGVEEALIISVIRAESNFDPRAVSRKGARGLMQLMPATERRFGVFDVFAAEENVNAGTRYLKELLQLHNQDLSLALASYNAGPERVAQFRGIPPFRETRAYVARVLQLLQRLRSE